MACKDIACVPEDDSFQHEWRSSKSAVGPDEFVLTKVMGLTNISKNALDCNQVTGYVAFPASCMLVMLDPKTNDQKFIKGPSGKSISCVSFSEDGRLVALGEAGVKPLVSVWPLKDHREHTKFVIDHSVGVKAIAIHPKLTYVVVIGMQDLNIGVWDYMRCQRLALTKWQTIPMSMTIPKSGSSVILCGHRKITLFNLDKINSNCYETNVFEDKKAVLLGRQSEYTFVDITSGKGKYDRSVYTVTTCGYLCEIRLGDILIDKACKVDIHAYCVRFALNHVFIGCCEGMVKICSPDTLSVVAAVSLSQLLGSDAFPQAAAKLYLETTALAVNEKDFIVTCIYANCSIYSWQINSFTDTIQCSVLLPPENNKRHKCEFDSRVTENVYRENMFRSLMGCLEFNKYSRLFDSETLAARNGMRCHHDLIHLIKGNTAKNQHVTTVRFSPDGRDVICGNEAGEIKVYDASSGILRRVIEAHSAQVMCIELLYDNDYQLVCTGGRDRIIFILNAKDDFSLVQVLCDHSAAVTAISLVSHDGLLTLVSAAADNLILVRRATPGNSLKFTVTGQIVESRCNKALNVTGDYIITGDRNGNIKLFKADPIFNPKLSKTLKSLPRGNHITSIPRPMCIDPTGTFIATSQNSGQIVIYHLQTGQPVASLSAQTDATAISFTNCLRYIISSTSNGCTMIWKMPERMTEFLVAKRNKSYEVAKEVSYETTIVSCVKICKEMTVRDSSNLDHRHGYTGPNSNHNYDTDATPSIESLSFLRAAHDAGGTESEQNSVCSTDSYLSCSTCRDSCSDTVQWCQSSDSSVLTNSGTDRFCFANGDNMCGKIIEDSECRKLGPFRQRSDDALKDNVPRLSFNSNSKTYRTNTEEQSSKSEYMQAIDCVSNGADGVKVNDGAAKKELRDFQTKMEDATICDKMSRKLRDVMYESHSPVKTEERVSAITNELKTVNIQRLEATALFTDSGICTDQHENKMTSLTTAYNAATLKCPSAHKVKHLHNVDFNDPVIIKDYRNHGGGRHLNRKQLLSTSPRNFKRVCGCSSPMSFGSYKTACSPQPVTSMDTSCSPGNSIFYSPSPCFSSDCDDLFPKMRSPRLRPELEYKEIDKRFEEVHIRRQCDEISSTFTFVGNLSTIQSSRMTDPCGPSDASSQSGILSSLSTNERRIDDILLQEISQTFQSDQKLSQAQCVDGSQRTSSKLATSPNTLKPAHLLNSHISNVEPRVSDFRNEISGGSSDIVNVIKLNLKDHINGDKERSPGKPSIVPDETRDKCDLSLSDLTEEEEIYNYHSITRDESGKLRLVVNSKNSLQTSPLSENVSINSCKNNTDYISVIDDCELQHGLNELSVGNIQCSRCSHREVSNNLLENSSKTLTSSNEQLSNSDFIEDSSSFQKNKSKDFNEQAHCDDASQLEYVQDINEENLEEYFSELRQCLQLTNSQETVYKLVCDAQDHELMELLELVLKKRSPPLMEALNLSSNQIENLTQSGDLELQDMRERPLDLTECKPQSSTNTIQCGIDKVLNDYPVLYPNSNISDVCVDDKCQKDDGELLSQGHLTQVPEIEGLSQNTAKALISLVGRILTSRRNQEIRAGASVVEKTQSSKTQFMSESKSNCGQKSNSSLVLQQKPEQDGCSLSSQSHVDKAWMQQHAITATPNSNMQTMTVHGTEILKEKGNEKSEESGSLSEISLYKTMSSLSTSRYGQVCSNRAFDSGIEFSVSEKLSSTRFQSGDRGDDVLEDECQGHTNWTSFSPDKTTRTLPIGDRLSRTRQAVDLDHKQPTNEKDVICPGITKLPEKIQETRSVQNSSGAGECKYPQPIVELFRDQDEYLKKLKEVREKFEMSIQALSKERKSRLAEEEKQLNK